MLTIHVVGDELYDEDRNEFINGFEGDLELEHSLVACQNGSPSGMSPT